MDFYEVVVSDLENLEKEDIVSGTDLRVIAKQRARFEEKLRCANVKIEEYLKYIEFEKSLLAFIRKGTVKSSSNSSAQRASKRKIFRLYQRCIEKNCGSLRVWFSFLFFCHNHGSKVISSRVISLALRFHPNSTGLWSYASIREQLCSGKSSHISIYQRALRQCSKKLVIWLDCLRAELQHANKLQIRFDTSSEILLSEFQKIKFRAEKRILKLFIAAAVYLEDSPSLPQRFLGLLAQYKWTTRIKFFVMQRMASISNVAMWNAKACLLLLSTKSCQNDRILFRTVFTPGSKNYEVLNIFFDSVNSELLQERIHTSSDLIQWCFYEHLTLTLLISYKRGVLSSSQLLDLFSLLRSGGHYLEGEFLKRFEMFPLSCQHMHPRYEVYVQDDYTCIQRDTGYKRDEETLLLKKFALSGRNMQV